MKSLLAALVLLSVAASAHADHTAFVPKPQEAAVPSVKPASKSTLTPYQRGMHQNERTLLAPAAESAKQSQANRLVPYDRNHAAKSA